MANYCVVQTGYSDDAATYGRLTLESNPHVTTNLALSTARNSEAFTAPSLLDSVLGVCLAFTGTIPSSGSVVAQLQEGGVDVAGASVTISFSSLQTDRWIFFKLTTPYTFTSLAAGHYRWRIYQSGVSSGNFNCPAVSATPTLVAVRSVDSRTGVPASGDGVMCVGEKNTTTYTLTFRGTQTIGGFQQTYSTLFSNATAWRVQNHDLYYGSKGIIKFDRAAGGSITIQGSPVHGLGGHHDFGTVADPILKANAWRMRIHQNGVSNTHAWITDRGTAIDCTGTVHGEEVIMQGSYVSGTGTAMDPVVLAEAMDFAVGDKFVIAGTVYNEYEERTIAAVISPTQYELSSALSFTHIAETPVALMTYSVTFDSNDPAQYWFYVPANIVDGNIWFKYAKFENIGGTLTNRRGLQASVAQAQVLGVDYCAFENSGDYAMNIGFSREDETFTGNVFYKQIGTQNGGNITVGTAVRKKFYDTLFIACERSAFLLSASYVIYLEDVRMWNCGGDNNGNTGGMQIVSSGQVTGLRVQIEGSRTNAIVMQNLLKARFQESSLGSIAPNVLANISTTSDNYNADIIFSDCDFGAGTLFNNYLLQTEGSRLVIRNKNHVQYANFVYTPEGIYQVCGAGLDDTTVTPLGNKCVRFAPEDDVNGLTAQFRIPILVDHNAIIQGKIKINSAFGTDDFNIEIYYENDPLTPVEVQTHHYTTGDWVSFSVSNRYTGEDPTTATIVLRGKSVTAGAYVYIGDLYNARGTTNPLASFDIFVDGDLPPIIADTFNDREALWNVPRDVLDVDGTIGKYVARDIATTDDIVFHK